MRPAASHETTTNSLTRLFVRTRGALSRLCEEAGRGDWWGLGYVENPDRQSPEQASDPRQKLSPPIL